MVRDMGIHGVSRNAQFASRQGNIGIALTENTVDFAAFGFFGRIATTLWANVLFDVINREEAFNMFFSNDTFGTLYSQNAQLILKIAEMLVAFDTFQSFDSRV